VDTGTTQSYFGRFQSSRDKLIVRAVAQIGQTDDFRNRMMNTLTAIGAVAGGANAEFQAAQPNTSAAANFSTAVAIFQGAVLTGLANIFPDHTIDFVNHINDLSFSASSTSKTVVPTKGSVPLVTFIAERPLEQLPFAYCGRSLKYRVWPGGDFQHESAANKLTDNSAVVTYCKDPLPLGQTLVPSVYPKPLTYSKWAGAALRVLESRTFVVVGGVHITEVASTPTLQQLNCPTFSDGTVNLSVATNGSLACSVTGAHLDKAGGVALEQGSQRVPGSIQATQDGSSATALFTASALSPLTGTFTLDWTSSGNPDTASGATLNFIPRPPVVSAIVTGAAALTPFSGTAPISADLDLTFRGTDLDQLAGVTLTCGANSKSASLSPFASQSTTGHTVTGTRAVTFAQTDLTSLGAASCTLAATSAAANPPAPVTLPMTAVTLH
jgi:hypothetical protein